MPGAEWFPGAQVNYAEHAFRGKPDDRVAIVHAGELRDQAEVTWGELREQVAAIAAGLRALGVERGDRVAAYMPNIPEAIAAFLADRLDRRRVVELLARLRRAQRDRPLRSRSSRRCCWRSTATATTARTSTARRPSRASTREVGGELVTLGYLDGSRLAGRLPRRRASSSSSASRSTTRCGSCTPRARPGCRRRSSRARAGSSLEHLKKLHLHVNAQEGDRIFWFTTTGWMMWNFLVGVPAHRGRDRALRRQPRAPGHGRAVGPRRVRAASRRSAPAPPTSPRA